MSLGKRPLLPALVLILLLGACASSTGASSGPGSAHGLAPSDITEPNLPQMPMPTSSVETATGSGEAVPEPTESNTSVVSKRRAKPPPGTDPKKWAPLDVSLNTLCLDRTEELVVTATSLKNSGIGFAVGYSDPPKGEEGVVPDYAYFDRESNTTGTMRWAFVVRPTVPYGRAVLKVVVSAPDGRGAFETVYFEVSKSCN